MRITSAKLSSIGLALAACVAATGAFAGVVFHDEVYIATWGTSTGVSGTLTAARYSSDAYQQIGCYTYADVGQTTEAWCYGGNASFHYVTCSTTDPQIVATARTINAMSYIAFDFSTTTGLCTDLDVQNDSTGL